MFCEKQGKKAFERPSESDIEEAREAYKEKHFIRSRIQVEKQEGEKEEEGDSDDIF